MEIKVLYFAQLRDKYGDSKTLNIADGSTVQGAFDDLFPVEEEKELMSQFVRIALNQQYVDRDAVIHHGDEMALIPPVAGG